MPHRDPEARKQYQRDWYAKNKAKVIPKVVERNKRYYAEKKALVKELKESSTCPDCGHQYPYYVMQFDHVSNDKEGNIADLVKDNVGRGKLLEEIAKCEIVCSNCHAVRTHNRRNTPG